MVLYRLDGHGGFGPRAAVELDDARAAAFSGDACRVAVACGDMMEVRVYDTVLGLHCLCF